MFAHNYMVSSEDFYLIVFICYQIYLYWPVGRVFANGLEDRDSSPGRDIQKTQKIRLDTSLFNTQHCKVLVKDKVENYS